MLGCCCYHKGTYFQANHNLCKQRHRCWKLLLLPQRYIFSSKSQPKPLRAYHVQRLLLLPQRYIFSSKSQLHKSWFSLIISCCCYHKGTYFQANHNSNSYLTTSRRLLLLPQRYIFSSKSQQDQT